MKNIVTFADSKMRTSLKRLEKQSRKLKFFDNIYIFDETHLGQEFIQLFGNRLRKEVPGFGYWIWKPQVVLQVLEDMKDGDCLLYVDAGCHLNPGGINRLNEYFEIVQQSEFGILGFEMEFNGHFMREEQWTKGTVFDYFEIPYGSEISKSAQIIGGIFLLQKRNNVVEFFQRWSSIMLSEPELLDDTASSWNYPEFITHRHDQSIFSMMSKLSGVTILSHSENFPADHLSDGNPDWSMLSNYPIWAKRDKSTKFQKIRESTFGKVKRLKATIRENMHD